MYANPCNRLNAHEFPFFGAHITLFFWKDSCAAPKMRLHFEEVTDFAI